MTLATKFQRLQAFFIDAFLVGILSAVAALVGGFAEGSAGGRAVMLLVYFMYFPLFTRRGGATPGKKWIGIRVVAEDGSDLPEGRVWAREFAGRCICPLVLGQTWLLFNAKRQNAWDMMAKSVVVQIEKDGQ